MKTVEELNGAKNVKNVQNAVEALRPDIERMMQAEPKDFQRYGVQVLMERYEINEDAARKIVDELLAGIHEFDEQYKALQQGENRVEKLLDSKTDEEKKNLLVQSLAALEVLKTSDDLADAGDLQEAIAKYESMPYEELLALFTQKINEGECFDEIVQRMEGVRTLNKEEMEKLRTFLKEHGEAYKFYVALALYMGHCDQKRPKDRSFRGRGGESEDDRGKRRGRGDDYPDFRGECGRADVASLDEVRVWCFVLCLCRGSGYVLVRFRRGDDRYRIDVDVRARDYRRNLGDSGRRIG